MTKVCRLCLSKLQRGSKYFNINAVESFTGFMPYRDQLTTCIPEMALDLIPNPVICNNCRTALKSSYDFKTRCLLVEKKIREYVESQPAETIMYDLNQIDVSSLPAVIKTHIEPERSTEAAPTANNSKLSELLMLKKEVVLPNPKEIEITNITSGKVVNMMSGSDEEPFSCNICDMKFDTVPKLHYHKTHVHEEDFVCNFCTQSFRSLQCLRKHNNVCMKSQNPVQKTVLAKRPHLPTKAKNHLKRWLFRHTDHPYPTDYEKQQLMKETNLSLLQVENWFINARRRILADLTKLKNLRDCEDILDTEPERLLLEESSLADGLNLSFDSGPSFEQVVVPSDPQNVQNEDNDNPLEEDSNTDCIAQIKMEIEIDDR